MDKVQNPSNSMNILAPKNRGPQTQYCDFLENSSNHSDYIRYFMDTIWEEHTLTKHISINLRLTLSHTRFGVFTAVHCSCGSCFCVMGQAMQNSFSGIWNWVQIYEMKETSYKRINKAYSSNNPNTGGYIYVLAFTTQWCCTISK
jgi:hypothetical protein